MFRRETDIRRRRSTDREDYQRVPRPVAAFAKDFASGAEVPPHSHPRAQLVYAATGVMRVTTPDGTWVVPPERGVWVPAGVTHEIRMSGAVAMRTLYIEPAAVPEMPPACLALEVSHLMRELILEALNEPIEYDTGGRGGQIIALILSELALLPRLGLHVPMPRDRRLAALCRALIERPDSKETLDGWAARVGASPRTLARLFQRETGLRFVHWRQQVRLQESVARLAGGAPVTRVAAELGYRSASAFSAMFRRTLGVTPKRYLSGSRPPR